MNLISISNKYPDQAACIRHLEAVRWGDNPTCPRCKSTNIARKADSERVGRWPGRCSTRPSTAHWG